MRLRRLEPVLRRALRGPCQVPPGGRVLVAVSGGADSTALLLALVNLAREFGIELHATHLHHGLRGRAADRDLAFVRDLCARVVVPFSCGRWNAKLRMKRRGLSGQAGLRTLRREFLSNRARRIGAAVIATAHNADDQLETLLMRLARGTGLDGLAGMHPRQKNWIKPMLEATRADIEADLARIGQPWCEDASNRDLRYARNRVRHEVVPALARITSRGRRAVRGAAPRSAPAGARVHPAGSARARAALARNAARVALEARDAGVALRRWIRPRRSAVCRIEGEVVRLDSKRVGLYPIAIQRTLLRSLWKQVSPSGTGLTREHLDALVKLVQNQYRSARVELPDRLAAVQDGGSLLIGALPRGAGGRTPSGR